MSWAEIKKAVNSDLQKPLNEFIEDWHLELKTLLIATNAESVEIDIEGPGYIYSAYAVISDETNGGITLNDESGTISSFSRVQGTTGNAFAYVLTKSFSGIEPYQFQQSVGEVTNSVSNLNRTISQIPFSRLKVSIDANVGSFKMVYAIKKDMGKDS